ncbi:hypothetical protein BHE74_00015049 [Ensete ventricosum]|nr:hypothetical protein GW17_00016736 [Ensete ventricosum]RWW76826.1 hypothetical protein BHE74_00015049 [Ensete ventricosum]RZS02710.1 hypothetical protein BHM03_00032792 [Ensete ventricosum]
MPGVACAWKMFIRSGKFRAVAVASLYLQRAQSHLGGSGGKRVFFSVLLWLCRFYPDEKQNPAKTTYQGLKPGGYISNKVGSINTGKSIVFAEDHEPWRKHILDPGSDTVLKWNRVFLISCLVALFIDPLYFYLPKVEKNDSTCIRMDNNVSVAVTFFRTLADLFYILHIVIKFRTAYVAPSSRVFGRGELVMDRKKIARRYLKSDFIIDLAAALPLPQVCPPFF